MSESTFSIAVLERYDGAAAREMERANGAGLGTIAINLTHRLVCISFHLSVSLSYIIFPTLHLFLVHLHVRDEHGNKAVQVLLHNGAQLLLENDRFDKVKAAVKQRLVSKDIAILVDDSLNLLNLHNVLCETKEWKRECESQRRAVVG